MIKKIHDTIIIIRRDAIVKVVEIVNKNSEIKTPLWVENFDVYSNIYALLGTIATIGALIAAIYAIYKTERDSRHQILVGKIEEIDELIVSLSLQYRYLYKAYENLEEYEKKVIERTLSNLDANAFEKAMDEINEEVDLKELIIKTTRLNVLANAYLNNNDEYKLKFYVIGYSQIFNTMLYVVKYQNTENKNNIFPERLPDPEKIFDLVEKIKPHLIKAINFGSDLKGYIAFRNLELKTELGMLFQNQDVL